MKILFLGRHAAYFRNFESVLRGLAARGHHLHLAVEQPGTRGGEALVSSLLAAFPNVTFGDAPGRDARDDGAWTASRLRLGLDYLRYQHALYDDAPALRDRARERTPGAFVAVGDAIRRRARWARRPAAALLHTIERALPGDPGIRAFLAQHGPDVILITPLIDLGSSQIDYLRAARELGIPAALCVWSWDHLSSKALIREAPDRVFVWNETQKREATELHGLPPERVVVTGAQCFDQWFDRQPSRDRATFCARVGLPDGGPFVLYTCSALFSGSPVEAQFAVQWLRRLRESRSPRLRNAPVLFRPHPSRMAEWQDVDLHGLGPVAVHGGNPVDAQSRADYFDALYHSAAVVGLNTSAFIEAGIVGRPVFTILLPEFYGNQMGTVHFRYLLEAAGGLLTVADGFDSHLEQLDASLVAPVREVRPFVAEFVRPHGLDVAATPLFVRHVEDMHGMRVSDAPSSALQVLGRAVARAAARARHSAPLERLAYSERELEGIVRLREAQAEKSRRAAEAAAERESARKAERAAERRAREEAKAARVAAARAARAARIEEKARLRAAKQARASRES